MKAELINHSSTNARPELLAPAGGPEAGYAALQAGADAVYLGLSRFSARAEAVNFSPTELADLTGYAHQLGKRVYATVNTLVKTRELPELLDCLAVLHDCRVDALIVQDLGILRVARRYFPELRIHASTQMAVHNRAGAEALRDLGVERVTLARELTLPEIADIARVPGIETECFLHGALCYSYSGLCLFSSLQRNGRSANRGRCAYPCRDLFTQLADMPPAFCADGAEEVGDEESFHDMDGDAAKQGGHIFSLKDLALPEQIGELHNTGVSSLKIEGRKKSPLYVSTVVNLYRRLLDGGGIDEAYEGDCQRVKTVFSRQWTGYFAGEDGRHDSIDAAIVGHRGAPTGTVELVRTEQGQKRLRFTTALPLERHDGLQADLPGESRPFGFAVSELFRVEDSYTPRVYDVPAGTRIEVALPPDAPLLEQGIALYRSSSQEVKREMQILIPKPGSCSPRIPVCVTLAFTPERVTASVVLADIPVAFRPLGTSCNQESISAELTGNWTPARKEGSGEAAARQTFDKTGDTPFALAEFSYTNPDNLFAPLSRLNALRRELYAALETRVANDRQTWLDATAAELLPVAAHPRLTEDATWAGSTLWSIKIEHPDQLRELKTEELQALDEVVIDLRASLPQDSRDILGSVHILTAVIGTERVRLSLPAILRPAELVEARRLVGEFWQRGFRKYEASNLGGLQLLRGQTEEASRTNPDDRADIRADWALYVLNPQAAAFLRDQGCSGFTFSPEDDGMNIRNLLNSCVGEAEGISAADFTLIVYQDAPLFIGESCARSALLGCSGDGVACARKPLTIQDSMGGRYQLLSRGCRNYLISRRPLCLSGRVQELAMLGLHRVRADFLYREYLPVEVAELLRQLQAGQLVEDSREGNFNGLLI